MPDVISIDWTARRGVPELEYEIDLQKAAMRGVIGAQASRYGSHPHCRGFQHNGSASG